MGNKDFKVIIPRNTRDLIALMALVSAKHTADGAASKIAGLEEMDWTTAAARIALLQTKQDEADALRRKAEKLQGEIDLQKAWMDNGLRATRDVLLGHFRSNPKALGDYGYTVNASNEAGDEQLPMP